MEQNEFADKIALSLRFPNREVGCLRFQTELHCCGRQRDAHRPRFTARRHFCALSHFRRVNLRLKADLALVGCSFLWGTTFVIVQRALVDSSVFSFLAARFVLAAVVLAFVYRADLRKLTRAEFLAGLQIGLFMIFGHAFQTAGLRETTPSKAAFVTGFSVVLVPVLLAIFWRRPANAWVWTGALASLAGLYYLTVSSAGLTDLNRGDLFVLVCSILFAVQIILIGVYTPHFSVGALSLVQVATGAVVSVVAIPVVAVAGWETPRLHLTSSLLFAIVATAVLTTALAFSVLVWAQKYTTATHAALILALEPVFAAFTSYVVIHERLGGRALVGAGLILAGILIVELKG